MDAQCAGVSKNIPGVGVKLCCWVRLVLLESRMSCEKRDQQKDASFTALAGLERWGFPWFSLITCKSSFPKHFDMSELLGINEKWVIVAAQVPQIIDVVAVGNRFRYKRIIPEIAGSWSASAVDASDRFARNAAQWSIAETLPREPTSHTALVKVHGSD